MLNFLRISDCPHNSCSQEKKTELEEKLIDRCSGEY